MPFRQTALLLIVLAAITLLSACGSSNSTTPVTVAFTAGFAPPTSLPAGGTAGIAATVANDPKNEGVNWSVTCTAPPCGSFNPGSTASTVPTTYTASTNDSSVNITATSVYDSTKFASATIAITQGPAITVTLTPPVRSSMNVGSNAPFTAVVANDPLNAGVNWSVTCGSASCGSFSQSATASSVATSYTAPASIPIGGTVTITATSVNGNVPASATVNITSAPVVLPDASYVFHLNGTDNTAENGPSPYFITGMFVVSGGVITYGELDFVDENNSENVVINNPSAYTLTPTPDGNLQITINTSDTSGILGVNGVLTFHASVVSSTRALLNEFDSFATATGSLDVQTSTTLPNEQGYAFFSSGVDFDGLPLAIGGVVNVDGPDGMIDGSGSVFDLSDAYNEGPITGQGLLSSSIAFLDSFGRVGIFLNTNNAEIGQLAFIGYIVNNNTIRFIEAEDFYGGVTAGSAYGQGANTGLFNTASLAGSNYVMGLEGIDTTSGYLQIAGNLGFSSQTNAVTGNVTFNDLGAQFAGAIGSGATFAVDSTGRVTVEGLTAGSIIESGTLQFYLDGNGNAFVASMDLNDVTAGVAYQQASPSFSGNFAVNADGLFIKSGDFIQWTAVGSSSVNSGTLTGFADSNFLGVTTQTVPNVQIYGTVAGSSQPLSGTLSGLGDTGTAVNYNYYGIDGTRAFGIESDDLQLGLAYFEQITN